MVFRVLGWFRSLGFTEVGLGLFGPWFTRLFGAWRWPKAHAVSRFLTWLCDMTLRMLTGSLRLHVVIGAAIDESMMMVI